MDGEEGLWVGAAVPLVVEERSPGNTGRTKVWEPRIKLNVVHGGKEV